MAGGLIALGLAVLGLMCCDRRTIVMIVIVGAMAAVLAYSKPGVAVGAESAGHSTGTSSR